ncbi:CD3337/EF1877 family mobilome membrane protein [Enterococcus faecalis]
MKTKWPLKKIILSLLLLGGIILLSLTLLGTFVEASGLVDDTINSSNVYSKYPLDNYQLDFYVDNSWGWLPWNWGDGIGKQVTYGLYAITNFIWIISLYLSNATGYLIQEAYNLDFISQTADAIGQNMQTIAGITKHGFSSSGFYVGFLLILVLALGIYVAYTGLLKRETTKAVQAVINFFVVFILSASFIAYAPDYIQKINEFSTDVSKASLDIGTKIILPNSDSKGKDSVDLIRDSLFSIQVQQPWLLLQYDNSDIESLGESRVEKLLSVSPTLNDGKDREATVKDEIENKKNNNLSITKAINRLGMVFFLFFFNIGISIFIFLLTGIMIFSQVLFIVYAMFLPISFLLSMIPSFQSTGKRAVMKLFNVIMTRAGITLIITVAFSISTMLYSLSASSPFLMTAFLQIVTFAGIYLKLGDLMSLFALQSNDSQGVGKQIFRKPKHLVNRQARNIQHQLSKRLISEVSLSKKKAAANSKSVSLTHDRQNNVPSTTKPKQPLSERFGKITGNALDIKQRANDKNKRLKEQVKDLPTQAKYAIHKKKVNLKEGIQNFSDTTKNTPQKNQVERLKKQRQHRQTIAQKRLEMEQAKNNRKTSSPKTQNKTNSKTREHQRPVTKDTIKSYPKLEKVTVLTTPIIRENKPVNNKNPHPKQSKKNQTQRNTTQKRKQPNKRGSKK